MTIMSEDGKVIIGVGGSTILHSLYSTAKVRIRMSRIKVGNALDFLGTGECKKSMVKKALDQMKIIRAELSELLPEEAIYDCKELKKEAPWKGNINGNITSCAELFTTENGENLIDKLIDILEYAEANKISIVLP